MAFPKGNDNAFPKSRSMDLPAFLCFYVCRVASLHPLSVLAHNLYIFIWSGGKDTDSGSLCHLFNPATDLVRVRSHCQSDSQLALLW